MTKLVSILNGGVNQHPTSGADFNGLATDFISNGVVGSTTNTSGVAPMTGGFAVNAQGTPNTTTQVSPGVAYVTATPTGSVSQTFRIYDDVGTTITHTANSSGANRFDWIYVSLDPTALAAPSADGSSPLVYTVSRSTSSTSDNGTPPSYGTPIAIVALANNFVTVTNANITDKRLGAGTSVTVNSVGPTQLTTGAITLGYAQITSGNFTTTSTSAVQVTGLTTTVTIPSGGRRVKITAYTGGLWTSAAGARIDMSIWDGTVSIGTMLQTAWGQSPNGASGVYGAVAIAVVTPPAGTKTYNVGLSVTGGTGNLVAATTQPAFILVEAI